MGPKTGRLLVPFAFEAHYASENGRKENVAQIYYVVDYMGWQEVQVSKVFMRSVIGGLGEVNFHAVDIRKNLVKIGFITDHKTFLKIQKPMITMGTMRDAMGPNNLLRHTRKDGPRSRMRSKINPMAM